MPKSRNRKKTQSLQKIPVIRKRETTFGIIKEHLGFKVVGIQAGQISRRKLEIEKEAMRAFKEVVRNKGDDTIFINRSQFIDKYISDAMMVRTSLDMIVKYFNGWIFGQVMTEDGLVVADGPTQQALITKMIWRLRTFHNIGYPDLKIVIEEAV